MYAMSWLIGNYATIGLRGYLIRDPETILEDKSLEY